MWDGAHELAVSELQPVNHVKSGLCKEVFWVHWEQRDACLARAKVHAALLYSFLCALLTTEVHFWWRFVRGLKIDWLGFWSLTCRFSAIFYDSVVVFGYIFAVFGAESLKINGWEVASNLETERMTILHQNKHFQFLAKKQRLEKLLRVQQIQFYK